MVHSQQVIELETSTFPQYNALILPGKQSKAIQRALAPMAQLHSITKLNLGLPHYCTADAQTLALTGALAAALAPRLTHLALQCVSSAAAVAPLVRLTRLRRLEVGFESKGVCCGWLRPLGALAGTLEALALTADTYSVGRDAVQVGVGVGGGLICFGSRRGGRCDERCFYEALALSTRCLRLIIIIISQPRPTSPTA